MKAITIKDIDNEVHRKFKTACAQNATDMRAELIKFMAEYPAK